MEYTASTIVTPLYHKGCTSSRKIYNQFSRLYDEIDTLFRCSKEFDYYVDELVNVFGWLYAQSHIVSRVAYNNERNLRYLKEELYRKLSDLLSDDLIDRLGYEYDYCFFESITGVIDRHLGDIDTEDYVQEYIYGKISSIMQHYRIEDRKQKLSQQWIEEFFDVYIWCSNLYEKRNTNELQELHDRVEDEVYMFRKKIWFKYN